MCKKVCVRKATKVCARKRTLVVRVLRYVHRSKDIYIYGKRGLLIWQKVSIHVAKEIYSHGKRGLYSLFRKRGLCNSQRGLFTVKRSLFSSQTKNNNIPFALCRHDAARRQNELSGTDAPPPAQFQYSMLGRLVQTCARFKPTKGLYLYGKRGLFI